MVANLDKIRSRLAYFEQIVNVDLTPEYVQEKKAKVASLTKYLLAYSTLVTRFKSRTDEFINKNGPQLLDQAANVLPELSTQLIE